MSSESYRRVHNSTDSEESVFEACFLFGLLRRAIGVVGFLLLSSLHVIAETRTISGLDFPVEALTKIDERSVKITLKGRSQIVRTEDLDTIVVASALSDEGWIQSISSDLLLSFAVTSALDSATDPAIVGRAIESLAALWKHPAISEPSLILNLLKIAEALEPLQVRALMQPLLLRLAGDANKRQATAAVLILAGDGDLGWVRNRGIAVGLRLGDALRISGRRLFENYLAQQKIDRSESVLDLLLLVFGSDDEEMQQLRIVHSRIKQVLNDVQDDAPDRLYSLIEVPFADPLEARILGPILLEFLHKKAGEALAKGDHGQALGVLARIDFNLRTPKTHALMLQVVTELQPSDQPPLVFRPIEVALRNFSAQDQAIAKAYTDFLRDQIEFLLERRRVREVEYYFNLFRGLYPDPSQEADSIRVRVALQLARLGELHEGRETLSGIQTGIGVLTWIAFYLACIGSDIDGLLAVAAAIIVTLLLLRYLRDRDVLGLAREFLNRRSATQRREMVAEEEVESERPQGFSYVTKSRPMSPTQQEYLRCLNVLGLPSDADLSSIKAAYRKLIKLTHPDAQVDHGPNTAALFVELTRAYDRLLELRQELGADDRG